MECFPASKSTMSNDRYDLNTVFNTGFYVRDEDDEESRLIRGDNSFLSSELHNLEELDSNSILIWSMSGDESLEGDFLRKFVDTKRYISKTRLQQKCTSIIPRKSYKYSSDVRCCNSPAIDDLINFECNHTIRADSSEYFESAFSRSSDCSDRQEQSVCDHNRDINSSVDLESQESGTPSNVCKNSNLMQCQAIPTSRKYTRHRRSLFKKFQKMCKSIRKSKDK